MAQALTAAEARGRIDEKGMLSVDEALPLPGPSPVRVLVMLESNHDEIDERLWQAALARNPAFSDLNDPAEDLYTLIDGKPFQA